MVSRGNIFNHYRVKSLHSIKSSTEKISISCAWLLQHSPLPPPSAPAQNIPRSAVAEGQGPSGIVWGEWRRILL